MSILNLSTAELIDRCDRAQILADHFGEMAWNAGSRAERVKYMREANYYADVACQLRFAMSGLEWTSKRLKNREKKVTKNK